ncbi:hypothetical protein M758_9G090100 [Ceratodon purpureus]|nr:hypothetical protein M758_9G090100 [Ceratodon purpureus]
MVLWERLLASLLRELAVCIVALHIATSLSLHWRWPYFESCVTRVLWLKIKQYQYFGGISHYCEEDPREGV